MGSARTLARFVAVTACLFGALPASAALIQYSATTNQFGATGTFSAIYDPAGFGGLGSLTGTITWSNMPILLSVRAFDRNTDAQMSSFGGPYLPDIGEENNGTQAVNTFWTAADNAVATGGKMEIFFTALDGNPTAIVQTSVVPAPGALGLLATGLAGLAWRTRRRTRATA
jgi:hypothetical protein